MQSGSLSLDQVFKEVVFSACQRGANSSFSYRASGVSPTLAVNKSLFQVSYIDLITKSLWILREYYLKRSGKSRCISEIRELSADHLFVKYRAVKVFPVFYADLIALSKYSEMKQYKTVSIAIESAWTKFLAPYVYEAARIVGVSKISSQFARDTIRLLESYRNVLHARDRTLGFIFRAATAYYATVGRCYSRREARYRYYYIRSFYDKSFMRYQKKWESVNVDDLSCVDRVTSEKIAELEKFV